MLLCPVLPPYPSTRQLSHFHLSCASGTYCNSSHRPVLLLRSVPGLQYHLPLLVWHYLHWSGWGLACCLRHKAKRMVSVNWGMQYFIWLLKLWTKMFEDSNFIQHVPSRTSCNYQQSGLYEHTVSNNILKTLIMKITVMIDGCHLQDFKTF